MNQRSLCNEHAQCKINSNKWTRHYVNVYRDFKYLQFYNNGLIGYPFSLNESDFQDVSYYLLWVKKYYPERILTQIIDKVAHLKHGRVHICKRH